jgi:hypothetical protein
MKAPNLLRILVMAVVVVGAVQVAGANTKVSARTVSGTGYFSGQTEYADGDSYDFDVIHARPGSSAIPSTVYVGQTSSQIKANYINWLNGYVTQDNLAQTHDLIGGAFIANSMLGLTYPGSTRTVSSGMWNDLVSRINRPDITASWVTVDPNTLSPTTSFNNYGLGIPGANDVFYAKWDPVARPIILFKNSAGTIIFAIEVPCGNPLGGFPGLPKIPPDDPPIVTRNFNCSSDNMTGVAWDPDSFGTTLRVEVYMNGPMGTGTHIASVLANLPEANGNRHAYSVPIRSYIKLQGRSFYVYANNVDPWGRAVASPAYGMTSATFGPCNDSQCGSSDFPTTMEVGVPQTFTTSVKMTYAWGAPYTVGNPAMHVTIWNPAGSPVFNSDVTFTPVPPTNTTLTSSPPITFTPATPGNYRMQWNLRGQGLDITCPGPSNADYKEGVASFLPYLSVYGGDVIAGSSPGVDASYQPAGCSVTSNAGVYSWNTRNASYAGAGASYAVMALGQIQDFASTQGSVGAPDRLSFANTTGKDNPPSGLFGGDAGGVPASCDFISDLQSTTVRKTATPIPGRTVTSSTDELFYKGDTLIFNDIKYATTSWASVAAMPKFKLVVIGDIYIDRGVGQLDGLYVALPDPATGKGGNIYTCSIGASAIAPTDPNYYTNCNKQLTVNGAFVAKSVQFLRTFGSMSKPGAAEQFNYSPELWLPRTVNSVGSDYNSITGLPPVL